ncbi:MAG TPA: DMT family protein [Holophagaceae bacterium]|nr:DMT family protein [Holophagaceae bacterium]
MRTILLLLLSNVFMTFAWYRHLKAQHDAPLWIAILSSWGIAFFEYCLAVPANRLGYGRFTLPQLKVMQEAITLVVFACFAAFWMKQRLHLNHLWAALCLVGAVFFTFR